MGISPRQFEELKSRVSPLRRRPQPLSDIPASHAMPSGPVVALGIDPSLRGTGWGVVRLSRGRLEALGHGTVRCAASLSRSRCLVRIAEDLRNAIRQYQPSACAVEGLFYAQNLQTALIMGEARGVCLLAAAEAGLEICEIAPRKVKQAIVGFGGAQKLAVARMVQRLLALAAEPDSDAADALAIAIAHLRDSTTPSLAPRRRL